MTTTTISIISIGLAMDAFAVSICKGLSLGKIKVGHMCIAGAWFGGFQALMPLIGYFLGSFFAEMIEKYDHWVAFVLLAIIGGNMIKEAVSPDEERAMRGSAAAIRASHSSGESRLPNSTTRGLATSISTTTSRSPTSTSSGDSSRAGSGTAVEAG